MNKYFEESAKISSVIPEDLSLLTAEELALLSSKIREELVCRQTTAPGKVGMNQPDKNNLLSNQEEVNLLLYNLVEHFNHQQKEYNELLFDLAFGLIASPETSDRDEQYRACIMLLYKVMIDLGDKLFPNSYINARRTSKIQKVV